MYSHTFVKACYWCLYCTSLVNALNEALKIHMYVQAQENQRLVCFNPIRQFYYSHAKLQLIAETKQVGMYVSETKQV